MSQIYDLHTHTYYSDGSLSPTELIERARTNGVTTLALTDHDVTDGLAEAQAVGARLGVRVIAGVEISVTWRRQTLHVLGLGVDPANEALQEGLARLRDARNHRAVAMDLKLHKKNISGAYDYLREHVRGPILSRTHFAQFLVARGYVEDMQQAFRQYLGDGRPGHVPGQWAGLDKAVGWIKGAGGIAVLAHPARYRVSNGGMKKLLAEFKECGGEGIEVISGSHGPADNERFAHVAAEHGFLASTGSDYHGPEKPWIELGRMPPLPDNLTPVWANWGPREWT